MGASMGARICGGGGAGPSEAATSAVVHAPGDDDEDLDVSDSFDTTVMPQERKYAFAAI